MFTISKQFAFSAAHRLMDLAAGHKCGRLHGHNYIVEVVFHTEDLNLCGFAGYDFAGLAPIKTYIDETFDHRTILRADDPLVAAIHGSEGGQSGDVVAIGQNPTAEWIATIICWAVYGLGFKDVAEVRISETPGTWAIARMNGK